MLVAPSIDPTICCIAWIARTLPPVLAPQISGPMPHFEEVALRLVEAEDPEALRLFLEGKLEQLQPERDAAQATMLASWLLELHLDHLNRTLLEARIAFERP